MEEKRVEEIEIEELSEEVKPVKSRAWLHILLIVLVVTLLGILGYRVYKWNKGIEDNTDVSIINHEYDIECMDYILPADPHALEGREDDEITTVLCLGNDVFADDYYGENNLTEMMKEELGENSEVINCSISRTLLTAQDSTINQAIPYDAYSFYWIATAIGADNQVMLENMLDFIGESAPEDLRVSVQRLRSTDFEKVDVIAIMYDAFDYLCNIRIEDADNETNITTYTGALAAGIQLIQNKYPHIRIMVMSPTYAYWADENGEYLDSDKTPNMYGTLATYAIKEGDVCYENSVSYIDNLYGTINANNAEKYLKDNYRLNDEGRRMVAKRFAECVRKYE